MVTQRKFLNSNPASGHHATSYLPAEDPGPKRSEPPNYGMGNTGLNWDNGKENGNYRDYRDSIGFIQGL